MKINSTHDLSWAKHTKPKDVRQETTFVSAFKYIMRWAICCHGLAALLLIFSFSAVAFGQSNEVPVLPTDILKLSDYLNAKSDRWLFIAALLLLLAAAYFGFRAIMKDRSELLADSKADRKEYQANLKTIIAEQQEASNSFREQLAKHTEVIERQRELLEKIYDRS